MQGKERLWVDIVAVRANKKEEKGKTLFLKVKSAERHSMRLRIEPTIFMF